VLGHYLSNGTDLIEHLESDKKQYCHHLSEQFDSRKKMTAKSCMETRLSLQQRVKHWNGSRVRVMEKQWLERQNYLEKLIGDAKMGRQ